MPRIAQEKPSAGSIVRHVLAVVIFLIAAGCSGGGCGSGCSSCGGFTPLAAGFDPTQRIENAGSARLTPSGLGFIQANLGVLAKSLLGSGSTGGMINFAVPKSSTSLGPITATICPNGSNAMANPQICNAQIDIGNAKLTITPAGPSDLKITGTIPISLQDIQVSIGLGVCTPTIGISIDGDGSCPGNSGSYANIPLDVDIAIQVDTNMAHTARYGYSQIKINNLFDTSAVETALDSALNICDNAGCSGTICCISNLCGCALGGIADWSPVKNLLVQTVVGQLGSTLSSSIDSQLCQKATATAPCPDGTTADSSMICRYADMSCASTLIGTDGHMNLGGLLQSISPGTTGGLDLLFAAGGGDINTNDPAMKLHWGDLDPVNKGVTIGLFGGAEANPLSKCVPVSNIAVPTGIPIPDELLGNADTLPNWPAMAPGPDVEIAVNERFANYALNSMYNSGLLCLGISTESIALLSSGTLGLLAPSAKYLGLQEEAQQVAIVIRPSTPPTIVFGNGTDINKDPNLLVGLKQVSLDFYIFSDDRFIRFLTATFDLSVPVNLTASQAGLTPVIQNIGVANGVVTNSQLLREMPATLASALGSLIGSLVGQQLAGSLKAISLNSSLASLGIELYIPDTVTGMGSPGLQKLSKGSDNYLGIFAGLALAGTPLPVRPINHTNVQITRKAVDHEGLKLMTLRPDNMPVIELVAESTLDDGSRPVEYQYKIDEGFWHPYQASRFFVIKDDWMRVQGKHVVYVRSKYVGDGASVDELPAQVEVAIDAEPPKVTLRATDKGVVRIEATDLVAPDPMVRYQLDHAGWSAWTPASHVLPVTVGTASQLSVEAADNEGNVGSASIDLVRGRFDGTASSCGCKTVGGDGAPRGGPLFMLGIALAGVGARLLRRAKRVTSPRAVNATAVPARADTAAAKSTARNAVAGACVMVVASTWAGCSCGKADNKIAATSSGGTTTTSSCAGCVELLPGLIGAYSSVAVSGADIWVAGYSEADYNNGNSYGDLVVGKWDGTKVDWDQVDGVPSTPAVDCTQYDCSGFRGGQTASGDDVGLWTSIALGADGNPAVAYYDRTHKALKFAQYNGTSWSVQQVDTVMGGDVGRYAKMLFLGGNFVIAYQSLAPGGTNGAVISKVRIATSTGGTPATGTWNFEDAVTVNTSPCRAAYCSSTQACVSTTKLCTTTLDPAMCTTACSSSQACVMSMNAPTCVAIWDSSKIDAYPDGIGDYITIAPDGQGGFGLAYYDRTNGNLVAAAKSGGTWTTTIVDGESAPTPSGDSGIGANLFIDTAGDWHITYVNGYSEALQYVKITGGKTVGTPEIVDDGISVAGTANTDGQHLVGDDSHLLVLPSGEVHVTYQDSTAGTLHYAVGTPGSTGHMWAVQAITQNGFAGAFSNIVVASGQTQLMNWWRTGGTMTAGDVRLVSPP